MEIKRYLVAFVVTLLVGCSQTPEIKTGVQKVLVPVAYVPAPPEHKRPELPIDTMTPDQIADDGEVAKYLKATIEVLKGYIRELEFTIEDYRTKSKEAEVIRQQVEEVINQNNEVTESP